MAAAYVLHWQDPNSGIVETVEFDLVTSAQHEQVLAITTHPVEQGAEPSDHASEEPARLTLEGFVSSVPRRGESDVTFELLDVQAEGFQAPGTQTITLDVPKAPLALSPTGLIQAGISAITSAINGPLKGTFRSEARQIRRTLNIQVLQQVAPRDRVRDVYDKLSVAQATRALISVQTPLREYSDMMLERLPAQQDDGTGEGAIFAIDLVRLTVADSKSVKAPEPAERRGQTSKAAGAKNGKDDPNAAPKRERFKSTAKQIADGDFIPGATA